MHVTLTSVADSVPGSDNALTISVNSTDQPRVTITMRPTSVVAAGKIALGGTFTDIAGNTNAALSLIVF